MKKLLLSALACFALSSASYAQETTTDTPDEVTIAVNRQNFRPYRNGGDNRQWADYATNTAYTDLAHVKVFASATNDNCLFMPCRCSEGVCTHENESESAHINIQLCYVGTRTYTTSVTDTDPAYYISVISFKAVPTIAGVQFGVGSSATDELPMTGKTYTLKYRQPTDGNITYTANIPTTGGRITLQDFTITLTKVPETHAFPEPGKYYTLASVTNTACSGYVITLLDGDKTSTNYTVPSIYDKETTDNHAQANRLWATPYNEEYVDGQLWKFVEDPENPGKYAIVNKTQESGCVSGTPTGSQGNGRWDYLTNPTALDYSFSIAIQSSGNEIKITNASNVPFNCAGAGQGLSVNAYTGNDGGNTWRFKLNTLTANEPAGGILNVSYDGLEGATSTALSYTAAANAASATTLYTRFTPTGATPGEFAAAAVNKVYSFWKSGLFEYYTAGQGNVSEVKKFDVNVDLKYYTLTIITEAHVDNLGKVLTLLDGENDNQNYGVNHHTAQANRLWQAFYREGDDRQRWAFIADPSNSDKYAILNAAVDGCMNSTPVGSGADGRWDYIANGAMDYGFNLAIQESLHEVKITNDDGVPFNSAKSGQGYAINTYKEPDGANTWRFKLLAPTHNAETAVPAIEDGAASLQGHDTSETNITLVAHPQTKLYVKFEPESNAGIATTAVGDTDENGFTEVALKNDNTYDYNPTAAGTLKWYTKGQGNVSPVASVTYSGQPTSIEEISTDSASNAAIYDLQGRRLSAPIKGINIIGGRKVLVK